MNMKRTTIFDHILKESNKNKFCNKNDLTNEPSVEQFFINRLISDLGYKDKHVKPKESISKLTVAKGSKKFLYKPDYVIVVKGRPRIVIDAKSPNEKIDDWIEQCISYCVLLNRNSGRSDVEYFMLSNGFNTALYSINKEEPLLELSFNDFWIDNPKYEKLRDYISLENILKKKHEEEKLVVIKKIDKEDAQKLFISCHKYIWKADKLSPAPAFMQFVKMIFLKLWHDKILLKEYGTDENGNLVVPESTRTFSVKWIESREKETINSPLNDLKYKELLSRIEDDILRRNKKRMFNSDDKIALTSQTIKAVVKKLENYNLHGIDDDLNGRLFETFLSATMRGEALGQYFTPRSIVRLAVKLADPQVSENHIDRILDACCGTGGFLIEALTEMRNKVRNNTSYSETQNEELQKRIRNESIFGIDAARDPMLARITRINMYLHGDGGSHIYFADSLDKKIKIDKTEDKEVQIELEELKVILEKGNFDIVLTNPPFSMWYEMKNEADAKILKDYDLDKIEGTEEHRSRLRSSSMFLERYLELLKEGKKLVSIIDETILSSPDYSFVRDYVRKHFIIRAIISLHGDAFQRQNSRVKTSLLFLEKKKNIDDKQPSVFMYPSMRLGVDDLPMTSGKEKIAEARKLAEEEIEKICYEFQRYKKGEKDFWLIPSERLKDRLDLKFCLNLQGRFINKWKQKGFDIEEFSKLANLREEVIQPSKLPEKKFKMLAISYEGRCQITEEKFGKHIKYPKMFLVRKGDLVISTYNSFNGAIGFITPEFDGSLASNSYIVLKCKDDVDALYLWSVLKTTEMRTEFLSKSVGMGRQTIGWEDIENLKIPMLPRKERERIYEKIMGAWEKEKEIEKTFVDLKSELNKNFGVESEESIKRFEYSKPPR